RLKSLWPEEARGRCARTPHRIGEHAPAVDLYEHGRMPEPGGTQPARRASQPAFDGIHRGQRRRRHTPYAAADELTDRRHGHRGISTWHRARIAEAGAVPARGGGDAFLAERIDCGWHCFSSLPDR